MKDGAYGSLRKAFRILELLAARSPRGVLEIAAELELEKSGVSRLLQALSRWGYVVQNLRRGQYQLGPRVFALVETYPQSDRLLREAQPVMKDLAQAARATVHLGVAVDDHIILVAKEPSPETIQLASRVGGRIAPHASALGKVLLAGLPDKQRAPFLNAPLARFTDKTITDRRELLEALREIRSRGYALEAGEEHPGVGCIGAPIRGRAGSWIAALSISGPLRGTPFRVNARHRDLILRATDRISQRLALPEEPTPAFGPLVGGSSP